MGDKYHSDDAIDNTPQDEELTRAVSSNWAYDHAADLDAHTYNPFEQVEVGKYLSPSFMTRYLTSANRNVTANRLHAIPFVVARAMTLDRIGIQWGVADAGKDARLGIYKAGADLLPGDLVIDAGTVDTDDLNFKGIVINQALTKGMHFLCYVSDGTPQIPANQYWLAGIWGETNSEKYPASMFYIAHAYGALPDPFGAPCTANNIYQHWMAYRVASLD